VENAKKQNGKVSEEKSILKLKGHHISIFKARLGWMGVSATPRGVREVVVPRRQRDQVEKLLVIPDLVQLAYSVPVMKVIEGHLVQAKAQLIAYCDGRRRIFDLPLDLDQGTEFQRKVWQETMKIPYGNTSTYLKLAVQLGDRSVARAVGKALGANPLPLIIPCHRIIASDGSLGGYSGGIQVKRALLKLEGII
jgi:O-6-methylguanine DNA methyltransferase